MKKVHVRVYKMGMDEAGERNNWRMGSRSQAAPGTRTASAEGEHHGLKVRDQATYTALEALPCQDCVRVGN